MVVDMVVGAVFLGMDLVGSMGGLVVDFLKVVVVQLGFQLVLWAWVGSGGACMFQSGGSGGIWF